MSRTALVIGYGNPLRGDDGIGQAAVQAYADEAADGGIEVLCCHQLMPELAERLAVVDLVVFVDAAAGSPPGSVVTTRLQASRGSSSGFAHHVDPGVLLAMSGTLYGRLPEAYLVSVGTESFALGEGLSAAVTAALPEIMAALRRLVQG